MVEVKMNNKLYTPWGYADQVEEVSEGILKVSTPSHGGFKLDRIRNSQVPSALRNKGGWYEEDCEYAKVIVSFPRVFLDESQQARACRTLKDHFPEAYEEWTGEVLQPGDSYNKDRKSFYEKHANDWIGISASSGTSFDPVPEGFVKVTAARGGRSLTPPYSLPAVKDFLVPKDEYVTNRFGFIVDSSRYQEL
jgi:hypothetical protein